MDLSSSRLVIALTTASVPLAVAGCGTTDGPPCFDGTYEVEFLERLPESDCPEAWAAGWRFTVEPVGVSNRPDRCRTCGLVVVGDPPPRAIGTASGKVFPYPVLEAGVVGSVDGDLTECAAVASMAAMIPEPAYADVATAAAEDAVLWSVPVDGISAACGVTVPAGGGCTDYYRSRMTKIADWDPE